MLNTIIRFADSAEIPAIASLWWKSWHEAHATIVPNTLVELRTYESFLDRVHQNRPILRVCGDLGSPTGLCYVVDEELQQLFVSSAAKGTGAAAALMTDAEFRLRGAGVKKAWLACAIGNARAERFYQKSGWCNVGKMTENLDTPSGVFRLETWRFEKELS